METATKTSGWTARAALVSCMACAVAWSQPATYSIDLTAQPQDENVTSVPGASASSVSKREPFPIELTISRIWPLTVVGSEQVEVELRLRNIGKGNLILPASTKYSSVLKASNRDRATMWIGLSFVPLALPGEAPRNILPDIVGFAAGSPDEPGSVVTLSPGESLSIKASGRLDEVRKWNTSGLKMLNFTVHAVVGKSFLDHKEFMVVKRSEEVHSSNSATMSVSWVY
jgi:hypothetical protein